MDLTYSDEQTALAVSADKFLAERYTGEMRATPGSFRTVMVAQGWYSLTVPADCGGLGLGMVEACLLAEQLGKHLSREPFVTQVYATTLADGLVDRSARRALLAELAEGEKAVAVAPHGVDRPQSRGQGGWLEPVLDVLPGTVILFVAPHSEANGETHHLHRIDNTSDMLTYPTVDGRTAGRLALERVKARDLGPLRSGTDTLALDRAVAAQVADMSGAMQAALDATVAYAKMRVQFGQPIGANQVIKHRLVEMAVRCEEARSLALKAAILTSDGSDATARARAVSGAKAKVATMARAVCEDAVQIHGGMGVTDELEVGWYLKRSLAFAAIFGTPRWHRARYGAMRGGAV